MLPAMVDHNVFRRSPAARAEAPPPRQRAALSLAAVVPSGGGASRQQAAGSEEWAAGSRALARDNHGQQSWATIPSSSRSRFSLQRLYSTVYSR